jgi:hypothetical protein
VSRLQRRVRRALEQRANLKLEPWHTGQGERLIAGVRGRLGVELIDKPVELQLRVAGSTSTYSATSPRAYIARFFAIGLVFRRLS